MYLLQSTIAKTPLPNLVVIASMIIALLAIAFFIFFVLARNRQNRLILEQEAMETTFQNQLMQSQIEIQESTFAALGQELHDNIGQLLSSTKLLLGITEKSLDPIPDTLKTAEETLAKAIQDLRSLSKSMNKEWLSQFNLIENLQAETERINTANTIHAQLLYSHGFLPLQAQEQVMLFRIIQEALQNSVKHAGASEITIQISGDEQHLHVSIHDNGKGFSQGVNFKNGVGILNMQHRTALLGGTIEWITTEGNGAAVQINLPIKKENL